MCMRLVQTKPPNAASHRTGICAYWIRYFVRWHGLRFPVEIYGPEVEKYLSYLANERSVPASPHKQAIAATIRQEASKLFMILSPAGC